MPRPGPHSVLVTLSLDFEDRLSSAEVERTVSDIEHALKGGHPQIARLFVEAQSLDRNPVSAPGGAEGARRA